MKITEYTELTTVASSDVLVIVDDPGGTPVTKKITVGNLLGDSSNLPAHTHGPDEIEGDTGSDGQVLTVQADGSVAWEDVVGSAVDALELKSSVKAATTANITLSGEQTIDGVACASGDRVLVKDQSTASENGIYIVGEYGWTRAEDYAAGDPAAATFGHIQQGTVGADKKWLCTNNTGTDTIGTHDLVFSLDSGSGGGGGVTGPASSTDNAIARWDGTGGDTLQDSSVTVDDNGRITAASGGSGGLAIGSSALTWDSLSGVMNLSPGAGGCSLDVGGLGISPNQGTLLYYGKAVDLGDGVVDWEQSNLFEYSLADGANSLSFTAPKLRSAVTKPAALYLVLIQGGSGNSTVTWPASVKWAGGTAPTLTASGGAVDIVHFVFDGTNYYGSVFGLDMQ